jgi:dienelactone hydrolase
MYSRRTLLSATATLPLCSLLAGTPTRAETNVMTTETTPAHLSANAAGPFSTQMWDARNRLDLGAYTVERVAFDNEGLSIVGNLFLPARQGRQPAIVMTGPVAYIKEQAPMQYASRLAKEGYAVLIYDPRYHGESAGMPRRFESRKAKVEDVRAAVAYLTTRPEVDRSRVHVVGFCQGMNWAVEAATGDQNVSSVALVAGHYLMPETAALYLGSLENVARRIEKAKQSKSTFENSGQVDYIPVVSLSDPDALLPARAIHDFYYHWGDRGPFAAHRGLWENRITRMSEADIWGHRIDEQLKRLKKPVLMVHSDRAASGPKIPRQLFDVIASTHKQAVWLEGRNQIQFYQDPLTIDMVIPHLDAHFRKHSA